MGLFKKKKSKTNKDDSNNNCSKEESARRNQPAWVKKRDAGKEGKKRMKTTDAMSLASQKEKQRFHMDVLFNLGTMHVGETATKTIISTPPVTTSTAAADKPTITESSTTSTPPGPIPFGSRVDDQRPPRRQMRIRHASEDDIKERSKGSEGGQASDDGRTVPTATSCSVLDIFSQYTDTLCNAGPSSSSNKGLTTSKTPSVAEAILEGATFAPYTIPREISFSRSMDDAVKEPEPTGYKVLESMEELDNKPRSLLDRLDIRKMKKKNDLPNKVKVYVDKPKPPTKQHTSSTTSVHSALTNPTAMGPVIEQ